MKTRLIPVSIAILAAAPGFKATAQAAKDSTLKGTTIEVIQSYKPEVKQAPKPEFTPSLPPADTTRPRLTYDVPVQTLYFSYHSLPLKPLALGRDSVGLPFENYIKAGIGNLSTAYIDAGIGSLKGRNYNTAFHLHHLSQSGNIDNQKVALTGLEAEGTLHEAKNTWHASAEAERNQYSFYGYNHDLYMYDYKDVKQVYGKVGGEIDMTNNMPAAWGLNYHPQVSASFFSASRKSSGQTPEATIGFAVPVTKDIDSSLQLQLGVDGTFTQIKVDDHSMGNNIFRITPAVSYRSGNFSGKLGLYPAFGKDGTYLLPDVHVNFMLPQTQFAFDAGWKGSLVQNTFEQLATKNPYVDFPGTSAFYDYIPHQTHSDEVFAGIHSNIGQHITFSGRVSWWQYKDLAMFVNSPGDGKMFDVVYDPKVNALSLQANIRYQVGNIFAVGVGGSWFNFYKKTYDHVWQEPGVRLKADLLFRPWPALTVTAYSAVMDQNYAADAMGNSVKLKGIFDVGAGAEYQVIPRLSVFLQANNLFNNKYERWMGYPSYGINIFGGIRFKF
ncbi:hypothetical protein ACTHGU_22065 [Chitinophagaceae bacterium MMS25-I14]